MKEKEHLIFGIRAIIEAINSGKTIEKLYLQKDINGALISDLRKLIKEKGIAVSHVPVQKLNKLTPGNHQGVAGYTTPIQLFDVEDLVTKLIEEKKTPLILLLDGITDVRNFGAICRTAECAGVDAIVIPNQGAAQINGDAIKTSAGALHRIPVCRVNNLTDTVFLLKELNLQIVGCTEKANSSIYEIDFSSPTAIIMGSEEKGISNQLLKFCDVKAKIPMAGNIASLNVSVASGIILYEAVKQRSN
ncbi:MAG: 23S rRNA (guanosine(2251)-2'-O)-methyltransferase RlmB [Vicingus serpentipes]|nr:23S rRNA (guanosine(2251)-2'-O)-methyltransferase RlmB [Vicingus serpentipes]